MSLRDRAAQFSPFAALTGHGDAVKEAARLTEERPELSEDRKEELDRSIRFLEQRIKEKPYVLAEWFRPDSRKGGGSCIIVRGRAERLEEELDRSIRFLEQRIKEKPYVLAEWFRPDSRKGGGSCIIVRGRAERLERYQRELVLEDGNRIPIEEICRLEVQENR